MNPISIVDFIQKRTEKELRQLTELFKYSRNIDVYLHLRNGPKKVKDLIKELPLSRTAINRSLYDLRKGKLISVLGYEEHERMPCGCMSTGPRFKIWGIRGWDL